MVDPRFSWFSWDYLVTAIAATATLVIMQVTISGEQVQTADLQSKNHYDLDMCMPIQNQLSTAVLMVSEAQALGTHQYFGSRSILQPSR